LIDIPEVMHQLGQIVNSTDTWMGLKCR